MIGLVLLHEKTQSTYSVFGGTLTSLEPKLKNVMVIGTGDEKALVRGSTKASNKRLIFFAKSTFVKTLTQNLCLWTLGESVSKV